MSVTDPGEGSRGLVQALWDRFQPLAGERVAVLESYAALRSTGADDATLREAATRATHNLHGSLGTYGRPDGSRLAMTYGDALLRGDPDPTRLLELSRRLRAVVGR